MTSESKDVPVTPGSASLDTGPMYSGKTSSMLTDIERKAYGFPCVIIKYAKDVRYGTVDQITSHNTRTISSRPKTEASESIRIIAASKLSDVVLYESEKNVGLDEGQFYPDLKDGVVAWLKEGRNVFVAALNSDYKRVMFPTLVSVFPYFKKVRLHTAICMFCHKEEAQYSKCIVPEKMKGVKEYIGGIESYKSCCDSCWDKV